MRLNSLYKFYQTHFGYAVATEGKSIPFGRAIADFGDVLDRAYKRRDMSVIDQYREGRHPRELTLEFLDNLRALALQRFPDPLARLKYIEHEIVIDPRCLVPTRKKGLRIASPFLWEPAGSEVIFLTFSAPNNMAHELGVFVTLAETLSTQRMPVTNVKRYTYWDVRHGSESSLEPSAVDPAPREDLIATCNRILGGYGRSG